MIKFIHLSLVIIWSMLANAAFLNVSHINPQLILDAGVNTYKFAWFACQIVWLYIGYHLYKWIKFKYWHYHTEH